MNKTGFVYILASKENGTLYVGVTADLEHRIWQHKNGEGSAFTKKYKVDKLVYYEELETMTHAIKREKNLKVWKRDWKIRLIAKNNPHWDDLYANIKSEIY